MIEIGLYQTSSSLPKINMQAASKRKGTKGSLSFFFSRRKARMPVVEANCIKISISVRLKISAQEARKRKSPAPIRKSIS